MSKYFLKPLLSLLIISLIVILVLSCSRTSKSTEPFDRAFLALIQGNIPDTAKIFNEYIFSAASTVSKKGISDLFCFYAKPDDPGLCRFPLSGITSSLATVRELMYKLAYSAAYDSLKTLEPQIKSQAVQSLRLIYYQLFADCIQQRAVDIPTDDLHSAIQDLKKMQWSHPGLKKYAEMLRWYLESIHHHLSNSFTEALIPAFAALSIHETELPAVEFPDLKRDLLYLIGRIYSHDAQSFLAIHYFELVQKTIDPKDAFAEKVRTNLFFLYDLINATSARDSLLTLVSSTGASVLTPDETYSRNLILGYYHLLHDREPESRGYFHKAMNVFDARDTCNSLKLMLYNYIADSFIMESNFDSATFYNDLALSQKCSLASKQSEQRWHMMNTRSTILYARCQTLADFTSCTLASRGLYDLQLISERLFDISDPHHSEASVLNTEKYLDHLLFASSIFPKDSLCLEAAHVMQNAKSRALIRGLVRATRDSLLNFNSTYQHANQTLNDLLRQNNSFRNILPFSDPIYLQIYKWHDVKQEIERQYSQSEMDYPSDQTLQKSPLQRFLQQNDLQIFQFLGTENAYYGTYMERDGSALYTIPRQTVDSLVRQVLSLKDVQTDTARSTQSQALHSLYALLFQGNLNPATRHIVILPDQLLSSFPFEALLQDNENDARYLIEDYVISYHFSLDGLLRENPQEIDVERVSILSWSGENTLFTNETEVAELSGGYRESQFLCELVENKCQFFSGRKLTVKNFESSLSSELLHLSTHAYSSDLNRLDNYFLLRQSGKPYKYFASHVPLSGNTVKHVVLSACESGTGTYLPGEGTYSISREFIQAGCEVVTKSLWKISDQRTAALMETYYEELKQGATVPVALRMAKLAQIKKGGRSAELYAWAGLIVEGNPFIRFRL